MKRYGALAAFAFAVLAVASVWLGGLNQDEGWYLYAANLVGEGKTPYRDFFYTQGPLLPLVYSAFTAAWRDFGLVGGRLVTAGIGLAALLFAAALARLLAPDGRKGEACLAAFMLLGCNLYHVYYTSIPKTYALASLFALMGFFLLAFALVRVRARALAAALLFASGLCLAFAAGARISLGALLAVAGFGLLLSFRRCGWGFAWFGLGGALGLAVVYGPFVALPGFRAAITYHTSRGGFDPVFTVGSLSRLVRWYLPIFILLGLGWKRGDLRFEISDFRFKGPTTLKSDRQFEGPRSNQSQISNLKSEMGSSQISNPKSQISNLKPCAFPLNLVFFGFLAVFCVQMAAPFPYEDYQVPIMGLLAVYAAVRAAAVPRVLLLTLGLTWAASFGSPLLEKWTTNGQDRFWSLKKEKSELRQLQDVARIVEALDPGGDTLLTQDLYLAIEANRRVPEGLEMGPFAMLTDAEWRALVESAPCEVAALSGYTFAIEPPVCSERPVAQQMAYWELLKRRYDLVLKEDAFGQNATSLLILKRKAP